MNHVINTFLNTPVQKGQQNYLKDTNIKNKVKDDTFDTVINKTEKLLKKKDEPPNMEVSKISVQPQTIKKVESILEKAIISQSEATVGQEEMVQMMMQLLMQVIQCTPDEIENLLNEQGISIEDLTQEDTFRSFIMEALHTDEWTLLNDQEQMTAMRALWEKLKTIQETIQMGATVVKQTQWIEDGRLTHQVTETIEEIPLKMRQLDVSDEDINPNIPKDSINKVELNISKRSIDKVELNMDVTNNLLDMSSQLDLGLSIPIQAFKQTQNIPLWKEVAGMQQIDAQGIIQEPIHIQLLEKIHYAELEAGKMLSMELTPKELGRLSLKLVEQNGLVTAQIKVEQDRTKELIMQNIEQLKEGFEEQGLTISNVQVEINKDPHHTHMEKEKQKSSKRIQELILNHMGNDETDNIQESITMDNLTSVEVDYKA